MCYYCYCCYSLAAFHGRHDNTSVKIGADFWQQQVLHSTLHSTVALPLHTSKAIPEHAHAQAAVLLSSQASPHPLLPQALICHHVIPCCPACRHHLFSCSHQPPPSLLPCPSLLMSMQAPPFSPLPQSLAVASSLLSMQAHHLFPAPTSQPPPSLPPHFTLLPSMQASPLPLLPAELVTPLLTATFLHSGSAKASMLTALWVGALASEPRETELSGGTGKRDACLAM